MHIISIITVIALIALDQLTKYIALTQLKPIGQLPIIDGVFHFSFVQNEGAAFGMLQGARWFFVVMTVIVLCGVVYYYAKLPKGKVYTWLRFALILIFSGAIGNFIDRFANGYVIDFLHFALIDFPVFNVADTYVVCGTILMGILMIFFVKETKLGEVKAEEIKIEDTTEETKAESEKREDAEIG